MKRKILEDTTTNRRVYHIIHDVDDDPYPEEYGYYHKHKPGRRGHWKSLMKPIWGHQMRMYRTWKHTRKTQWKPK
jgi:hypothetical protein